MFKASGAYTGFSVKDLDEAKKFYSEILGLGVEDGEMGITVKLPGGAGIFVYPKENHEPATYTVLNFIVEDIDESLDALVEKGVKFEQYNMPDFEQDEKGIARGLAANIGPDIAWFKDPSGNIFSILQEEY